MNFEKAKLMTPEEKMSYKKGLNDPDNHDAGVSHLESDILECEVRLWNIWCVFLRMKTSHIKKVKVKVKSCPTLCDPMNYTVHGILQARTVEWVASPFSRGSSQPRDRIQVSRTAGGFFTG